MKERPILFSARLVRAILAGRKTQTRRVIKPSWSRRFDLENEADRVHAAAQSPYGFAGDRLWVREAFRLRRDQDHLPPSQDWWNSGAWYEADRTEEPSGCGGGMGKLRPSIFMPRWASRITLEITDVRVERLRDISEADAVAEGFEGVPCDHVNPGFAGCTDCMNSGWLEPPWVGFHLAWDELNAKRGFGWETDPWAWVIEFGR